MSSKSTGATAVEVTSSVAAQQKTVAIHTHGCKLNQADSQSLARQFREAGYLVVDSPECADVVVLNTCTVTATADSKARQFLRAARRRNPEAMIVATGCYAQRAPAELEKMEAVSLVVGNTGKEDLFEVAHRALREPGSPLSDWASPPDGRPAAGRTRAMVKIQEGCDQVCAYCIVPKVRGRERSITPEHIIREIDRHHADGYREVALTGTQPLREISSCEVLDSCAGGVAELVLVDLVGGALGQLDQDFQVAGLAEVGEGGLAVAGQFR